MSPFLYWTPLDNQVVKPLVGVEFIVVTDRAAVELVVVGAL